MSRRRSVARAGAGILLAALALPACAQDIGTGGNAVATTPYVIDTRPEQPSYDELVALRSSPPASPDLERKLDALLETPFVNNEAFHRGAAPFRPIEPGLQQVMRVVSWNIERGLQLDLIEALFTDDDEFRRHLEYDDDDLDDADERRELERELELMRTADVIVLQELDWGMKRTGYARIAERLGRVLDMNWAFGVEFVEVDPFNLGTEDFADVGDLTPEERAEMRRRIAVDEGRYEGLHGTAVLSRYPIRSARLLPLRAQGYDWFNGELENPAEVEEGKRDVATKEFLATFGRETRRGGRTLLLVELDVPDLPSGTVTIAAAHLEGRAEPKVRREQITEVLSYLGNMPHPVVLAGDMNTSGRDGTPISWKREIYKRVGNEEFWAQQGLKIASGLGIAFDAIRNGVNLLRSHSDPTVADVPVLAPNDESEFFEVVENFRFADGGAFDFRGDKTRAVNGAEGTLANSNHREGKGFATTFQVDRGIGRVSKLKLDWIFVKAFATDPRDEAGSYRFAPHFGRTMEVLNDSIDGRISDHSPITVDLPLAAPRGQDDCCGDRAP